MKEKKRKNIVNLIFIGAILLSFMYSMGFQTNFVQIRGPYKELYDAFQNYNRSIFNLTGLLMIFGIGFMVAFDAHKKTERMVFSKIAVTLSAIASFIISYIGTIDLSMFISAYSKIDVNNILLYYPKYEASVAVFYIGYFVFGLLTIMAILNIIDVFKNKVTSNG